MRPYPHSGYPIYQYHGIHRCCTASKVLDCVHCGRLRGYMTQRVHYFYDWGQTRLEQCAKNKFSHMMCDRVKASAGKMFMRFLPKCLDLENVIDVTRYMHGMFMKLMFTNELSRENFIDLTDPDAFPVAMRFSTRNLADLHDSNLHFYKAVQEILIQVANMTIPTEDVFEFMDISLTHSHHESDGSYTISFKDSEMGHIIFLDLSKIMKKYGFNCRIGWHSPEYGYTHEIYQLKLEMATGLQTRNVVVKLNKLPVAESMTQSLDLTLDHQFSDDDMSLDEEEFYEPMEGDEEQPYEGSPQRPELPPLTPQRPELPPLTPQRPELPPLTLPPLQPSNSAGIYANESLCSTTGILTRRNIMPQPNIEAFNFDGYDDMPPHNILEDTEDENDDDNLIFDSDGVIRINKYRTSMPDVVANNMENLRRNTDPLPVYIEEVLVEHQA